MLTEYHNKFKKKEKKTMTIQSNETVIDDINGIKSACNSVSDVMYKKICTRR